MLPARLAVAPSKTKIMEKPSTNASEWSSVMPMFFLRDSRFTSSS
jgi:hypothetical protein